LGGAGKGEPTIVTPKQYRQRFLAAMERYFPLVGPTFSMTFAFFLNLSFKVPDRWMKQSDTPEEDSIVLSELWPDW